jgi:hypothetical protein
MNALLLLLLLLLPSPSFPMKKTTIICVLIT